MKKKFNLVMTVVAVSITLGFAVVNTSNGKVENELKIEKKSGDYAAFENVKLQIFNPETQYKANKIVIGENGEKSDSVKYDLHRDASEEVLKNKSLYRDTIRRNGYLNYSSKDGKYVISTKNDYIGNVGGLSKYRNTIYVAYDNGENIRKFNKTLSFDENINLLKIFEFQNKVYILLQNNEINQKEKNGTLALYEIDVENKKIIESEKFEMESYINLSTVDIFYFNNIIYINGINTLENDEMNFMYINMNDKKLNYVKSDKLNSNNKDLQVESRSSLEGDYIYTIVTVKDHLKKLSKQYLVKFNTKLFKFEEIKDFDVLNNKEKNLSVSDFKVNNNNLYLLYNEEEFETDNNYTDNYLNRKLDVITLNEDKKILEVDIQCKFEEYIHITLIKDDLDENQ